ncbi:MAG: Flp pilus assembly protein CpaB [Acidobacteria bacterium]|nr:Flp pilus assembly protein CpaB [Acidobacteriota bacterium]
MTRIRIFIVLFVAIGLGGTFAFATYRYIQRRPVREVSLPTTPVVVASADLALGTELRRDDLRVIAWPADAVPAGSFTDVQDVIGRGLVQAVAEDETVLPAKLAPVGAGAGLPPIIPEGKRAVSVRVNDVIGVAGYVLPGTHVDVLATVSPTNDQTTMTSKVVLTNVLAIASGTRIEQDAEQHKPIAVSVVTLLVDPSEAERLTLASTEGKIQLALRNPLDKTAPPTPGIQPAVLLGYARPVRAAAPRTVAAAAPAPPSPPTVEIIRGDKRVQEVVRQE